MLAQGGVTLIVTVLRSATAVKAGQDPFSVLTVDPVDFSALTIV